MDSICAVVPARAGSKRLPNKNIMLLGGISLLEWSIRFAVQIQTVEKVVLVTDIRGLELLPETDEKVCMVSRPPEVSGDGASTESVVIYLMKQGVIDSPNLLLLQPTNPFRSLGTVSRVISGGLRHGSLSYTVAAGSMKPNGNLYFCPSDWIAAGNKFSSSLGIRVPSHHDWEDLDIDFESDFDLAEHMLENKSSRFYNPSGGSPWIHQLPSS